MLGCFSTNKERIWGVKRKATCGRELIPLVKPCYSLFLLDLFEDGNIFNYNNLTHMAGSALSTAICGISLIGYWLVSPLCVYIDVWVNCKQKQVIP